MGRRESLDADVFQPLWAAGWQWVWIVAGALFLGVYLVLEFGDSLEGVGIIAGGGALAALGIRYVNRRYETVLDTGIEQAQSITLEVLGTEDDDVEVSSIPTDGRALLLVSPAREYELTTLVVSSDSFVVHDDATVSLAHRYVSVGDDAHHYEYTELSAVTYEAGRLRVVQRDGTADSYAVSSDPKSALSAARERIAAVESQH
ncbi:MULTISPECIES: hypothetical protein [Haloferax]|uniref:Uncharacterized protein n=1 Tax=Haloferax marinum TaxID=2666143 RepID=A0A6A8GA49_9EURY|nr:MULTISPECIES: hypothetical protein [Haloferax]KAB1191200.1 hypothetical protein Hfx1150_16105 [Haloferax sp. CBA1150]MRW98090.1 hypothetical protein [Haloferax marinum]